jgi:hypothetical protein
MADNLEPGLAWTEIPTVELGSERMHAGTAGVAGVTCAFTAAEEAPFLGRGIAICDKSLAP